MWKGRVGQYLFRLQVPAKCHLDTEYILYSKALTILLPERPPLQALLAVYREPTQSSHLVLAVWGRMLSLRA